MTCPPSHTADSKHYRNSLLKTALAFLFCLLPFDLVLGAGNITLTVPTQIALPSVPVTSQAQTVYSGDLTMELFNRNSQDGWLLTGEISGGQFIGSLSGDSVSATLSFKSVTWLSGGQGSSAGLTIHPDGTRIEADPGFGIGRYEVVFEVIYDVPPFPSADDYLGVSTFIVQ